MLEPGTKHQIQNGPLKGFEAEITAVVGDLITAVVVVFGQAKAMELRHADFGLEFASEHPTNRPFDELLEEFERLYQAAAPLRYELLQPGLADADDRCQQIPGVVDVPVDVPRLYAWRNGMSNPDAGWKNEFEENSWYEASVLDDLVHFYALERVIGNVEMWERIAAEKRREQAPCYWRTGFIPILEAPFWLLMVIDTRGLFGGQPGQIISFDYKTSGGYTIEHESLNKWLETKVELLKAGLMFTGSPIEQNEIERAVNKYYTRNFPGPIPLDADKD